MQVRETWCRKRGLRIWARASFMLCTSVWLPSDRRIRVHNVGTFHSVSWRCAKITNRSLLGLERQEQPPHIPTSKVKFSKKSRLGFFAVDTKLPSSFDVFYTSKIIKTTTFSWHRTKNPPLKREFNKKPCRFRRILRKFYLRSQICWCDSHWLAKQSLKFSCSIPHRIIRMAYIHLHLVDFIILKFVGKYTRFMDPIWGHIAFPFGWSTSKLSSDLPSPGIFAPTKQDQDAIGHTTRWPECPKARRWDWDWHVPFGDSPEIREDFAQTHISTLWFWGV